MFSSWNLFNFLLVFFLSYQVWKVSAFDQVIIERFYSIRVFSPYPFLYLHQKLEMDRFRNEIGRITQKFQS